MLNRTGWVFVWRGGGCGGVGGGRDPPLSPPVREIRYRRRSAVITRRENGRAFFIVSLRPRARQGQRRSLPRPLSLDALRPRGQTFIDNNGRCLHPETTVTKIRKTVRGAVRPEHLCCSLAGSLPCPIIRRPSRLPIRVREPQTTTVTTFGGGSIIPSVSISFVSSVSDGVHD